jgi:hypothetical protein
MIHALQPIAANEEITISYPSSLEFVLKPCDDRRAELHKTWRFQCNCPSCADTSEDALRQTAHSAHQDLVGVVLPSRRIYGDTHNRGNQMQQHREYHGNIESLEQFIAHLVALDVKDIQLANA